MTITPPKEEIEKVVKKGASVKEPNDECHSVSRKKPSKIISQKIRIDVLNAIQDAVSKRPGMNRSIWIQEAIAEKLERLNESNKNSR